MSRPSFGELGGRDPYDILELPSGASDDDVRAARKRLLRKYHPDMPSGDLRRTQLITAAADLLLDPLRRLGYYVDRRDAPPAHESRRQRIRPTFVTPTGAGAGVGRQEPPPIDVDPGYGGAVDTSVPAARWSVLAIASVVAILTWTPLPLVLGLLALRQIRRHGQRGKGLALAGVIVGALFVVVYAYIFARPGV